MARLKANAKTIAGAYGLHLCRAVDDLDAKCKKGLVVSGGMDDDDAAGETEPDCPGQGSGDQKDGEWKKGWGDRNKVHINPKKFDKTLKNLCRACPAMPAKDKECLLNDFMGSMLIHEYLHAIWDVGFLPRDRKQFECRAYTWQVFLLCLLQAEIPKYAYTPGTTPRGCTTNWIFESLKRRIKKQKAAWCG